MSEGLRAEDVKEALDEAEDAVTYQAEVLASEHPWPTVVAAARAWLASQEQTPDYEAAAYQWKMGMGPRAIVDAALVGFHPQADCDCEDGIVYTGHDGIPNMEPCPIHAAQPEGAER